MICAMFGRWSQSWRETLTKSVAGDKAAVAAYGEGNRSMSFKDVCGIAFQLMLVAAFWRASPAIAQPNPDELETIVERASSDQADSGWLPPGRVSGQPLGICTPEASTLILDHYGSRPKHSCGGSREIACHRWSHPAPTVRILQKPESWENQGPAFSRVTDEWIVRCAAGSERRWGFGWDIGPTR